MTTISSRRARRLVLSLFVAVGLSAAPAPASAAVDTFIRFEEEATANWTVTQHCPDGSVATTRITVIAGEELESPDLDDVSEFVTVLIRGFDCEGNFVNERGSGQAVYTSSPSLSEASVTGTVILRNGDEATVAVTWEGTGGLETTVNQTQFDGFVGIFTSKERQATATGTVVVDGETLVSGPAGSASIETLEDRNRTLPSG
jgi:hypothetical protein